NHSALDIYEHNGRLHGHPNVDAADTAYTAWLNDKHQGLSTILIASDNATVADLNARAQADLVAEGLVDIETTVRLRADIAAGVGDEVLARRNDRSLRDSTGAFIANGTRLTLTGINPDGSAQATNESTGGTVTLDVDYLASSTELGYATTAHRSQGVTVDTGHTVVEVGQSRELFYVAMTRGRMANHAYVDLEEDDHPSPDQWDLLHKTPGANTPVGALKAVLDHSTAERAAHEVSAAERAWANDLGRLVHEFEFLDWAERAERTHAWIDAAYPDPAVNQAMRDPETWNRLVKVDPARTYTEPPSEADTPDTVLTHCQAPPAVSVLEAPPAAEDAPRAAARNEVRAHLFTELDHRVAATRAEQPAWLLPLAEQGASDEDLRAVLLWRAVSNQDDAEEALGRAPEDRSSLAHHYQRAAACVSRLMHAPADEPAPSPEPGDVEDTRAQTSAQVAALTDDALDFSWVNDLPDEAGHDQLPPPAWELDPEEPDWTPSR
ncbi:hypothetical protein ACFWVA_13245, partial [Micrococcus luteus]